MAIVDPPYGGNDAIGLQDNQNTKLQATARTDYKIFDNTEPTKEYWEELFRVSKNQIVWGCNFYKNINLSGGRLVWDKKGTAFGRAEEAYLSMTKSVNIFEYTWNGMIQHNMHNKEYRIHPTQNQSSPLQMVTQEKLRQNQTTRYLTHVGSGSSRIACYDMGFDFMGCELDEDYWKAQEGTLPATHSTTGFV